MPGTLGYQTLAWSASEVAITHFSALTLNSEPNLPIEKRNTLIDFLNPIMRASAAEVTRRRQESVLWEAKDSIFNSEDQQARHPKTLVERKVHTVGMPELTQRKDLDTKTIQIQYISCQNSRYSDSVTLHYRNMTCKSQLQMQHGFKVGPRCSQVTSLGRR